MVSVNPHIYAKMPFDPAKDLVPVAAAARVLVFLVVRTENPSKDFKAFLADLKAQPRASAASARRATAARRTWPPR